MHLSCLPIFILLSGEEILSVVNDCCSQINYSTLDLLVFFSTLSIEIRKLDNRSVVNI